MIQVPVLSKIDSIFEYAHDEKGRPTGKTYDKLSSSLIECNPITFKVTAKMDGTCCYIKDGAIYARQDVKHSITNAPVDWFQTSELDANNHIIGFRPLKKGDKWHFKAIDADNSKATFLEYNSETNTFHYNIRSISDFNGKTAELVGPSVNGNKHKLEKNAYIIHGSIEVTTLWHSHEVLKNWLETDGIMYEGIVIHDVGNNTLYKCHRGHLELPWNGYTLPVQPVQPA